MRKVLPVLWLAAAAALHGQSVAAVLHRMDQAAPVFHAMAANIKMVTYTAIIDNTLSEQGTLKMQRLKGQDVRAVLDFSGDQDAREIGFFGKIVRIYYPRLNSFQDYNVGKNVDVLNQFILLGFGSSGRELSGNYTITDGGQEKLGGRTTTKLVLTPKTPAVASRLSRIEMWVPEDVAYPIQQKFIEPSGNYRTVTYTDVNLKPSIKGRLDMKLPSNVKKQSS